MLTCQLGCGGCKAPKFCNPFPEFFRINSLAEPAGNRGKDVPPMKGVANRLQKIVLGGDVADAYSLFALIYQREDAVVGRQKQVFAACGQGGPPCRSYAWVHHNNMKRIGRLVS